MVRFINTFLLMLQVVECFIEFQYRGMALSDFHLVSVIVSIVVNLGQTAFKFAPANVQRILNPCFTGPLANMQELFSIVQSIPDGGIDQQESC